MGDADLLDEYQWLCYHFGTSLMSDATWKAERDREAALRAEILRRMASGGACWRLGCMGHVPEGKVGCAEHRLDDEDEDEALAQGTRSRK